MPASGIFELEKILIAALVTAVLAYLNQLWKYNRDAYQARVDEACRLIFEMADTAADYWTKPKAAASDLAGVESKIAGRVVQLQFLRLLLEERSSLADRDTLRQRVATFQDALTGGTFRNAERREDIERSDAVFQTAADLVEHIRRAATRGNRWWRILLQHFEYRRPTTPRGQREEKLLLSVFAMLLVVGVSLCCIQLWVWYG